MPLRKSRDDLFGRHGLRLWLTAMVFDLAALYRAMAARRQELGLSWIAVARATGVAAGTLQRAAAGGAMEADGVLAMVDWLGVDFEVFCAMRAGGDGAAGSGGGRFDTRGLYAALDGRRRERGMGWADLAGAIGPGVSAPMLTRLAKGGRANIQVVAGCCGWLGVGVGLFRRGG